MVNLDMGCPTPEVRQPIFLTLCWESDKNNEFKCWKSDKKVVFLRWKNDISKPYMINYQKIIWLYIIDTKTIGEFKTK